MSVANRNPSEPRSGSRSKPKTAAAMAGTAKSAAKAAKMALKEGSKDWGFSATYFVAADAPYFQRENQLENVRIHRLDEPGANQVIEWLGTQPKH